MKWTSSNSSLNSSSDRKSVFYTTNDTEVGLNSKKQNGVSDSIFTFKIGMADDEEGTDSHQKTKLFKIKDQQNNDMKKCDMKKYLQNLVLFSNFEKQSEKKFRDEQLTKIVKALLYMETKLRQEQKIIQQQLYEKDAVINRQMHTITNMKEKYGECSDDDGLLSEMKIDETAKYCPMCRKKYYLLATTNASIQTNESRYPTSIIKNSQTSDGSQRISWSMDRMIKKVPSAPTTTNSNKDYSSIQSIEYMSSSEEQETMLSPNPFTTARRSKKYTSKKSYKEYLRTRQQNALSNSTSSSPIESNFLDSNSTTCSTPTNDTSLDNKSDKDNTIIAGKENSKQNAKFSLIMNDIHGIKLKKLNYDDTHSTKINRMHGINQHQQPQPQSSQSESQQNESKENLITITNVNEDKTVYNNMMIPINMIVNSSAAATTITDDEVIAEIEHSKTLIDLDASKKKYTEGMEVKRRIAIATDDWYVSASASDVDDSDTLMGKSHCNTTTVNPVLECVNQILLQQSMDEFMDNTLSDSKTTNNNNCNKSVGGESKKENQAPTTRSSTTKRVHFSTKNSMVQVPRNPTPQSDDTKNSTYEHIQSIYSNEYEPIGGSENSNTNYYVDVDGKDDDMFERRKPPALPPKPANLMKLQQISKQRLLTTQQKQPILKQRKYSDYESNESEPDYCSISEIQEEVKSVKIITSAEIHQISDNDNEYSEIKEEMEVSSVKKETDLEESFADVPKLPNVTEIIPPTPRKESPLKCIGTDNYITKSPYNKKGSVAKKINLDTRDDSIANGILAEINNVKSPTILKNKKASFSGPVSPSVEPNKTIQQAIKIVDEKPLPLQAEFDWYNLDAEYGRPNNISQPDVVKDNLEEMYQYDENLNSICDEDDDPDNQKIEYNLDFEYNPNAVSSTSSPDIVEIEKNNNFTTVIKINNDVNLTQESQENHQHQNNNNNNSDQSPVKNCNKSTINHFIDLSETPKIDHYHHKRRLNYEKFLSESGLSTKPIILPRRTNHRMFYTGPFV